MTFVYFWEYST